MPYDGSGVFSRSYNWVADKVAAIKIRADRMDAEFDNYATALNQVILRSGVVPFSGTVRLGDNPITGLAAGTEGSLAVQFAADASTGFYLNAAGELSVACGNTERARFTSEGLLITGGFIGLNTLTPRTSLDLGGGLTSMAGAFEEVDFSAAALTGTVHINYNTAAVIICETNAAGNWTFNVRGDAGVTLDSIMAVGQILSFAVEVPQGVTAYYCTAITVDGAAPSQTKWQGGAPAAGNPSGVDVYLVRIAKKAAATFYVRASQTQEL